MVETKLFLKNEIILLINVKVLNALVNKWGKSDFNVSFGGNGEKKRKNADLNIYGQNRYLNAEIVI